MISKKMVALIGEQPIPNLLPIKYERPESALLVRTARTKPVSQRLEKVLKNNTLIYFCEVDDPYSIADVYQQLSCKIDELGWLSTELVFNLTGGTKPMALAAYQVALDKMSEFLYLESERGKSLLRRYKFEGNLATLKHEEIVPSIISIADYLSVHLDNYQVRDFSEAFEKVLFEILRNEVDEVIAAVKDLTGTLDLDLVVRVNNQVGIIEVKTGRKAKKKEGIDQLNTAGGRAFLGTYTKKFLIVDCSWENSTNLSELAVARNIEVIQLPSYGQTNQLSDNDKKHLIQTLKTFLGGS